MKKSVKKEIISWILVFSIAFLVALLINKVVLFKVKILSGSMIDTINIGDKVYAFRQAYLFKDPQRGDIIVFPFPDNEKKDYIKRIIGLPGEVVEGIDGQVYIDGEPIEEDSYITDPIDSDFGPFTAPEDSYFMMGDNRLDSADSRVWENPYVDEDKIKGKAVFKYPDFHWLY